MLRRLLHRKMDSRRLLMQMLHQPQEGGFSSTAPSVFLCKNGGSQDSLFRTASVNAGAWSRLLFPVKMAARVPQRLGPRLAKIIFASRSLHCSTVDQAGGAWRVKHGFPENPSNYGPMTDLPDWSFADGRPAPPMKGHLRRQEKNKEFARRVAMISAEMDRGIEKWEARQRELQQQAEEKRHKRLQPKGSCFQKPLKYPQ